MNIFLYELKSLQKSILIWAISLTLITTFYLSIYPAFSHDVEATKKVLENIPYVLRSSLGISLETFFTLPGFYSFIFSYVVLAGSIQSMNLGLSLLSKEYREKTNDFLLTKPVKRINILIAKLLAGLADLLVTNAIYMFATLLLSKLITKETLNYESIILVSITLLFIQLFFLSIGALFSQLIQKIKSVVSISLPTVFVFFILNMLGSIIGEDKARYITPFKFYDYIYIIRNNNYEYKYMILEGIVISIALILTFLIYIKKDIDSLT